MKIFLRKLVLYSFVLCLVFVCTSCFEIVEEVNFNNDGSGSFCFTVNLSQSKLDINTILLLDSVNGRAVPKVEDIKKTFARVEAALALDSSISNVKTTTNWENYIFSIAGNFKNVNALNKAINNIYTLLDTRAGHVPTLKDNYSYDHKLFKRLNNYNLAANYNSLSMKDKVVFKNAVYTSIYRFKTPIESYSNLKALKSKSGMSMMLKNNVTDIITNTKSIENSIQLN